MTAPVKRPDEAAVRRANGRMMMTVGALMALLCGSCTAIVGLPWTWGSAWEIPTVLGVLPAAGGVALFVNGLMIWRRASRPGGRSGPEPQ